MRREQVAHSEAVIHVENIGGIESTDVTFTKGVNVLAGRNATNRTSLLQSVIGALGGSQVSLKGDAEEGVAELELGGESFTRTLTRTDEAIDMDGSPMLQDPTVADLFAFLLESNEARRAVTQEDDLRDLIMRPVDTTAIRNEIRRLESEKREVLDQLDEFETIETDLAELQRERNRIRHEIEEAEAELEAKAAAIESEDEGVAETRELQAELTERLDELNEVRSSLETVRSRLKTERKSLDALREEYDSLQEKMDSVPETPAGDVEELDARLDDLRFRKNTTESRISDLNGIIQFNREMVTGEGATLDSTADTSENGDRSVADGLLPDDDIVCWTCGTAVNESDIEENIDRLRDLKADIQAERNELRAEIEELKTEKRELEKQVGTREQIQRQYDQVQREIANREATLEELEAERAALSTELESVEADVESLQSVDYGDVLEKHKAVNQLEFEVERLESERDSIDATIQRKQDRLADAEDLSERLAEINERLTDLRNRIGHIEDEAVAAFNDHMETILDRLDFENIDRIWIEKRNADSRGDDAGSVFDLHVVRSADDVAYEDTIAHLSESERAVTGLVFALAGYLVHDVHEAVPVICLDSLESVDAGRIATLVEYFQEYTDYLIVALLPEDADAIDTPHNLITDI